MSADPNQSPASESFDHSVVRDADGNLQVLHHHTHYEFDSFDRHAGTRMFGRDPERIDTVGIWFTSIGDRSVYGPVCVDVQLDIRRPLYLDDDELPDGGQVAGGLNAWEHLEALVKKQGGATAFREWLTGRGYDGVAMLATDLDGVRQDVWIALEPSQIRVVGRRNLRERSEAEVQAAADLLNRATERDVASEVADALDRLGLPRDIEIADEALRAALTEGRWVFSVESASPGRYELAITPDFESLSVGRKPEAVRFGPDLIDYALSEMGEGPVGPRPVLRAEAGFTDDMPWRSEAGYLYRGVSWEEWQAILSTGRIQSNGSYNLGEAQEGLTYFTTDPEMAASYASSYQPWHRVPTFERPGYVIKIRRPPEHLLDTESAPDPEIGVRGAVNAGEIVDAIEIRPYAMTCGSIVLREGYGGYETGSRTSPMGYYGYAPVARAQIMRLQGRTRPSFAERALNRLGEEEVPPVRSPRRATR